MTPLVPPANRRNFWLGVLNGLSFTLAETLADPTLVLVAFISRLTEAPVLIGLVTPLRDAGWFLPQLWISGYVQSQRYKLPFYRLTGWVRLAGWTALVAVPLLPGGPGWQVAGLFLAFGTYAFASGFGGLAFMEIVGKTIPPHRRTVFFAWRLFLGALAGLGGAAAVRWLISADGPLAYPYNFSVIFGIGWVAAAIGLWAFGQMAEPPDLQPRAPGSPREQLRRGWAILSRDANYRQFVLLRASQLVTGTAVPFFAVYVQARLNGSLEMVGAYLWAVTGAALVTNLVVGRWAGRLSHTRLLQAATLAGLLMGLSVAGLLVAAALGPVTGALAGAWLVPVFVLNGLRETCLGLAGQPLLLAIAPPEDRSLYLGFTNTILGLVMLSTGLSGVVVAGLGFPALLGVSLLAGLFSLAMAFRLREPAG